MKQKMLLFLVLILFFGLILSCRVTPHVRRIYEGPVHREDFNWNHYLPFSEGNRLAVLNREASLRIYENIPRLDGATALYPVFASFAQAVYPSTENFSWWQHESLVRLSTTPRAFRNLINGYVDIIFTAAPSQGQVAMAAERGKTFNLTPIGRDAFVFFVNRNNVVNELTTEQIRGIYSGLITNWAEVGGENAEIIAFQRERGSGSQTALEALMEGVPIMNPPRERTLGGMNRIIYETASYTNLGNAIGFSFLFFTTEMVNNDEIKLLSIDGILPTIETIQSGEYPFSGIFYAITTGNETENTIRFIEWILSDEGQYLIEKTGYVPIR